jgi:hypothetical protein
VAAGACVENNLRSRGHNVKQNPGARIKENRIYESGFRLILLTSGFWLPPFVLASGFCFYFNLATELRKIV